MVSQSFILMMETTLVGLTIFFALAQAFVVSSNNYRLLKRLMKGERGFLFEGKVINDPKDISERSQTKKEKWLWGLNIFFLLVGAAFVMCFGAVTFIGGATSVQEGTVMTGVSYLTIVFIISEMLKSVVGLFFGDY